MSATRLYEWTLHEDQSSIRLAIPAGLVIARTSVVESARWWPTNAWMSLGDLGRGSMHRSLAEGEALAAAVRKGLIHPEKVRASYRLCKRRVSFYAGGVYSIGREYPTVVGPVGEAVTAACRLYPNSLMASAWLIARDEILERGLAVEGRAAA